MLLQIGSKPITNSSNIIGTIFAQSLCKNWPLGEIRKYIPVLQQLAGRIRDNSSLDLIGK